MTASIRIVIDRRGPPQYGPFLLPYSTLEEQGMQRQGGTR